MSLKIGDQFTLTVHDIAFGGEGVGRVDDFVVFVPFVLVGEAVEVEVREVKKNFARARLLRVVQPSPERVEPACRYFSAMRRLPVSARELRRAVEVQAKANRRFVRARRRVFAGLVGEVIPCPQPFGYRNRIMIRSQWNKPEQKLNIGFVRWDCGLVEDIEECKIAEPALNRGNPARPQKSAAERRHQGGVADTAGKLGRAAGLVFSEQFFPAAQAG